jgi:GNAT superfamily N-acetyltransferase
VIAQTSVLDGVPVVVENARPGDLDQLIAFAQKLSPASQQERFFAVLNADAVASEMRNEMTESRNLSLLARRARDGRVLGHALGAVTGRDRAEVAFTVADEARHHGVGTLLLRSLMTELRDRGVHHFEAVTQFDNRAMLRIFEDAGFRFSPELGCVEAHLDDPVP